MTIITRPKLITHVVLIFSFIICTAVPPAHAQLLSSPPPPPDNFPAQYSTSSFTLAMTVTLVFVILVFVITSLIAICINRFATDHNTGQQAVQPYRELIGVGLDPSLIEMFPVLDYTGIKGMKIGNGPLECAVCLSEFVDNDKIRLLLPGCCHAFHPDCIDGWLKNHVTCPVCRSELTHNAEIITSEQHLAIEAVDRFMLRLPEHVQRDIEASRSGEQQQRTMAARIAGHRYEILPVSNSGKMWSFLRVFSSRRQPDIEIGEGSVRSVGSVRRDGSVRSMVAQAANFRSGSVRSGSLRLSASKEEATDIGTVSAAAVKSNPEVAASCNSAPSSPSERCSTELATLN